MPCSILHSSCCMLKLCGIICMVIAACLNNSQQLLSSSDICSSVCLSKYTINAHNLYVCMQLLSKTGLNGTSLLSGNLFSNTLTMVQHLHSQRNLCYRSATLYRFLHIGTKWTNTYHHKHPATSRGLPKYAKNFEHSSINICLSAACDLHFTSENHHHLKIYSLLSMVLSGIKRKQATN